jgi:type IV secretion system protein VirB4
MNFAQELQHYLLTEISYNEIILISFGIVALIIFALIFITKIGEYILPPPKETHLYSFLPFKRLLEDGKTIKCKNGTLVRIYKIEGINMIFASENNRAEYIDSQKRMLDSLGNLGVEGRVITVRKQAKEFHEVEHTQPLMKEISEIWSKNISNIFQNNHFIILSINEDRKSYDNLNEACTMLEASLSLFSPTLMYENATSNPKLSPFKVFADVINPISRPSPKIGFSMKEDEINSLLTSDKIEFTNKRGVIKYTSGDRTKYAAAIGIRNSADYVDEQMLSEILTLNCELNVLHNFSPMNKIKAIAMLVNQKKMAITTSYSYQVVEQYDEALATIEESDENYQSLTHYALTIFIHGNTREELTENILNIEKILRFYAINPVIEGWVAEASWFTQFPTYNKYPRLYRYLSKAVATSINFEKMPEGHSKSDWGDGPITVFKTAMGTSYQFQFHVSDAGSAVGHTITIGPTGQGKTTLFSFLAGQALRHEKLKVFFFDRNRGAEIFTHSIGGSYINFEGDTKDADKQKSKGGKQVSLNPLRIENTAENRAFLRRWLKLITYAEDAQSEAEIGRAVTTSFDYLRPEERLLKNLYKSLFSPGGHMRKELYRWVDPEQYGHVFNSEKDTLDLSSNFTTFDCTYIFEDETLAPAIISYVMNRINNLTGKTGDPSLIIIDETAPMLKHPMFRDYFIIGLREGRKKRQAYLAAFQQPNIIDQLGIGEVVRGQMQTAIFFRNPGASDEDYENWNLTPKEMAFIKGKLYRELKYAVLLSRPITGESVVLDVNLGSLGKYLKVFDSGRKSVLLVESLRKQYGDDFIKHYINS